MPYFIQLHTGVPYAAVVADSSHAISAADQSLMTSILSVGTFFGAIMAGDIADFFGRRFTIILGCAVFAVGCILETASTTGLGVVSISSVSHWRRP